MPEFLGEIEGAKSEEDIRSACEAIKTAVVDSYPTTPNSRRKPMTEVRKAIRDRYPATEGKTEQETVPFPYFWTNSGKGNIPRWEHLAIKYLAEEWNTGKVTESDTPIETPQPVEQSLMNSLGLTDEESLFIQSAIAESGLTEREWLATAILQRAKQDKALKEYHSEDLSSVPSETLMNDKRYRVSATACRELTSRAVRVIKDFNDQSPEHKWCITNSLISELTGNTPKAIAKAVDGMDLDSYNQAHGLTPVNNRLTKRALGKGVSELVSIKDMLGYE